MSLEDAWLMYFSGDLEGAERIANAVYRRTQNSQTRARAAFLLGLIAGRRGRNEEAVEMLREAERLGLRTPQLYLALARLLYKLNRLEGALRAVREARKLESSEEDGFVDTDVLVLEAKILIKMGRRGEARQIIERLVRMALADDEVLRLAEELSV